LSLECAQHRTVLGFVAHSVRRRRVDSTTGARVPALVRNLVTVPRRGRHVFRYFHDRAFNLGCGAQPLECIVRPPEFDSAHPSSLTRFTRTARPGANLNGPWLKSRRPASTRNSSPPITMRSSGEISNDGGTYTSRSWTTASRLAENSSSSTPGGAHPYTFRSSGGPYTFSRSPYLFGSPHVHLDTCTVYGAGKTAMKPPTSKWCRCGGT